MNNIQNIIDGAQKIGINYRLDAPMSEYTSFRTGGKADVVFLPSSELQLRSLLRMCSDEEVKPFIFGNGSNLLVSDDGIRGVSIRLANNFEEIRLLDETTIYCSAGTKLATLCKFALEHSLTGLEFAYGIPGSVGGAVYMNAGAYGGDMKDVVTCCTHIDYAGNPGKLAADMLGFSYRKSVYTGKYFVISGAVFSLQKGNKEEIDAKMQDILGRRVDKQPLDLPSAGSFFKHPDGHYASALIEQCGLKGFSVGGAQVSEKHAGFVVNKGGATTADIMELGRLVAEKVLSQTGVELEREVKYIG